MEFHIKVLEARKVPAADLNGKSDPFVTLNTSKTKNKLVQTKVIKKTLTPTWNEEFTIKVDFVSDSLIVGLFDYDRIGSNDQLGFMHIPIHDLNIGCIEDRWWVMHKVQGVNSQPELHLITQLVYKDQPAWMPLNLLFIDCFIKVKSGENLPKMDIGGTSDPYVKLTISTDTDEWATTRCIKKSLNPTWDESFLFYVTNPTSDSLQFKVWDKDAIGSDDLMGTLTVPLNTFQVGVPQEKSFALMPPNKKISNAGSLKLFICLAPKGTLWTDNPKGLPRYEKMRQSAPPGMPQGGFPPAGYATQITYPMPQIGQQPGMPMQPQPMPGYPPQGMPGYPPQGMQGYPSQQQMPGYPPQAMPGYPPQPQ